MLSVIDYYCAFLSKKWKIIHFALRKCWQLCISFFMKSRYFLVMLALEISETICIIRVRISEAISFYLIDFLRKRIN